MPGLYPQYPVHVLVPVPRPAPDLYPALQHSAAQHTHLHCGQVIRTGVEPFDRVHHAGVVHLAVELNLIKGTRDSPFEHILINSDEHLCNVVECSYYAARTVWIAIVCNTLRSEVSGYLLVAMSENKS